MYYNQLIIFDLDDTLVDTSQIYWQARTCFIELMVSEGFEPAMVLEEFEKIDTLHMETMQFSPERYGKSMVVTYEYILSQFNRSPSPKTLSRIKSCGRIVLEQMPEPIDGAHDLLAWASKFFELALLTRGNEALQKKKLRYAGLSKYFNCIQVVSKKDTAAFEQIINKTKYLPSKTWVLGDSIKSDINPAIQTGARCILYLYQHPCYVWRQEAGFSPLGPFYTIDTLSDAKDIFKIHLASEMIDGL